MANQSEFDGVPQLVEAEYKALRDEILQRLRFQRSAMGLCLIAAGTFIKISLDSDGAASLLVLPILIFFLTVEWTFNEKMIHEIGRHIGTQVESRRSAGATWEQVSHPAVDDIVSWLLTLGLPAYGVFVGSQLMCLLIAWHEFDQFDRLTRILCAGGWFATLGSFCLVTFGRGGRHRTSRLAKDKGVRH